MQDEPDEGYNTGSTYTGSELTVHNLSATQPSASAGSVGYMESNLKLVQESRHRFQKYEAAKIQQKLSQLSLGHGAPLASVMAQTKSSNAGYNYQVTNVFILESTNSQG